MEGAMARDARARGDEASDGVGQAPSIKLSYPKNRLLLGTVANMDNRGVHKALDTKYPLELSIEAHDLPAARARFLSRRAAAPPTPFAVIYFRSPRGGPWELIGRTETVAYDEYARFVTKLKLSCATVPDRLKEIRVVVYDRRTATDDLRDQRLVGTADCRLDDVVSEALLRKELPLRNAAKDGARVAALGHVVLSADVLRPMPDDGAVVFDVELAVDAGDAAADRRLFYVLSRQIRSGDYTAVYRSEVLERGAARFRALQRATAALTAGVEAKLLRLELYQFDPKGNHCKVGFMQTSLDKLRDAEVGGRQLWWPAANDPGVLEVGRVMLAARDSADDVIRFKFRLTP